MIGDGALLAAGPLLVASQTSEPALVAAAVLAQRLPWILFSLISGVYADRLDRRQVIIIANIVRAAAIGSLTLAIGLDSASLMVIYAALFMLGVGDTLAENAEIALLPSVVPKKRLELANSWLQGADVLGRQLLGPPLGAYLFVVLAVLPFGLDVVTFVVAALIIATIKVEKHPKTVLAPRRSMIYEAREGIFWLSQRRQLKAVALSIGVMNITFMAAFASFVLYVQQQLGLGPVEYGILLSVSAVGGVIGMRLAPMLAERFSAAALLRAGLLIEAIIDISFAANHSPWLAGIIYAVFGMHSVVWGVITTSLRQRATPDHLLGRVNSVYSLFSKGGLAVGALLGGVIAHVYGIAAPFWFAGVVMMLWAGIIWKHLADDVWPKKRI